jgi:hypothetical protein
VTLDKFADFPGILAAFRGDRFEAIMDDFLVRHAAARGAPEPAASDPSSEIGAAAAADAAGTPAAPSRSVQMREARIPVAVSAFDLITLSGRILRKGSMARAARASATFPFLFQPVGYRDESRGCLLIDGGLADVAGVRGTKEMLLEARDDGDENDAAVHTVINLSVGGFLGSPPGPSSFAGSGGRVRVASVSIHGLPPCGPWAMSNGPRAVDAAFRAMLAALDAPLRRRGGDCDHYELRVDAAPFLPQASEAPGG